MSLIGCSLSLNSVLVVLDNLKGTVCFAIGLFKRCWRDNGHFQREMRVHCGVEKSVECSRHLSGMKCCMKKRKRGRATKKQKDKAASAWQHVIRRRHINSHVPSTQFVNSFFLSLQSR